MEIIAATGLLGLGFLMSQNKSEQEDKKNFTSKVPLNKKPNGNNIYESNRSYEIFEDEWKNSGPLFKDSQNPSKTNVIYSGPPKALFLNKVDYEDKKLPVEFNSAMTYDMALLDPQDVKTSANLDNDRMKNNMSKPETGGWHGISLTGDQINPGNFTHNNMQPFFGSTVKQNMDEYATRGIFENFTGDMDSYQKKKEQGLLFEPQKNVTNVYGASNLDGYQLDRYYVSNVRSNETPIEKMYIAPSLNDGYSAEGGGFIRGNGGIQATEYAYPKTTDEIRVKTNPKISYYGRIISGAHIAKPGKIGTVFKNQPDTFYINSPDRYFTTTGAVEAQAARPAQVLKYTNRQTTELKTRVNGAAPTHGSKGVVRSKYKVSNKVSYENKSPRNATVEGKWSIMGMLGLDNTPNDYGKQSIRLRPNARTETGDKTTVLNVHSKVSKGEARNGQKAKRTVKEVTENNNHSGMLSSGQPSRGFVYDPNDKAKTTLKETYENNEHNGYVDGQKRGVVYDPNDVARTTIKEQNIHNSHNGNIDGEKRGVVYDPNDVARTTIKETSEINNNMGNVGNQQKRMYIYAGEQLPATMKETTMVGDIVGIASGMERNDGYLVKEVNAPTTHREQTSVAYTTNANKNIHGGYEVTDVQMPGTNRMFSVEYTGNVGNTANTSSPMSYEDIYNSTMKSVRDEQDRGYTPNAMAPSMGVDPKDIHATTHRMGDIQNKYIQERGVIPSTMTNSIPQMSECNMTSNKETLPNEPIADRINPDILNAFKTNPYSQSLSSWA
jgi:hypothetical protein